MTPTKLILEEWLRPDESIEYRGDRCQVFCDGEVVFSGSFDDAYYWQRDRRIQIINAKLNALLVLLRGEGGPTATEFGQMELMEE